MRPSDLAGTDYRIRAMTSLGEIRRIFRAFDRDDAMEQLLSYCYGEALPIDVESIEITGPAGVRRHDGEDADRLAS